jgi:hypothetical protein
MGLWEYFAEWNKSFKCLNFKDDKLKNKKMTNNLKPIK